MTSEPPPVLRQQPDEPNADEVAVTGDLPPVVTPVVNTIDNRTGDTGVSRRSVPEEDSSFLNRPYKELNPAEKEQRINHVAALAETKVKAQPRKIPATREQLARAAKERTGFLKEIDKESSWFPEVAGNVLSAQEDLRLFDRRAEEHQERLTRRTTPICAEGAIGEIMKVMQSDSRVGMYRPTWKASKVTQGDKDIPIVRLNVPSGEMILRKHNGQDVEGPKRVVDTKVVMDALAHKINQSGYLKSVKTGVGSLGNEPTQHTDVFQDGRNALHRHPGHRRAGSAKNDRAYVRARQGATRCRMAIHEPLALKRKEASRF